MTRPRGKRAVRRLGLAAGVVALVLVVAAVAVWHYLSNEERLRRWLDDELEKFFGQPVEIARARMEGLGRGVLTDVRVGERGDPWIVAEEAVVDLAGDLGARRVTLTQIRVLGAQAWLSPERVRTFIEHERRKQAESRARRAAGEMPVARVGVEAVEVEASRIVYAGTRERWEASRALIRFASGDLPDTFGLELEFPRDGIVRYRGSGLELLEVTCPGHVKYDRLDRERGVVQGALVLSLDAALADRAEDATTVALLDGLEGLPLDCIFAAAHDRDTLIFRRFAAKLDDRLSLPVQGRVAWIGGKPQLRVWPVPGERAFCASELIASAALQAWMPEGEIRVRDGALVVPDATNARAWSWEGAWTMAGTGAAAPRPGVRWGALNANLVGTLSNEVRDVSGHLELLELAATVGTAKALHVLPGKFARVVGDGRLVDGQPSGNGVALRLEGQTAAGEPVMRLEFEEWGSEEERERLKWDITGDVRARVRRRDGRWEIADLWGRAEGKTRDGGQDSGDGSRVAASRLYVELPRTAGLDTHVVPPNAFDLACRADIHYTPRGEESWAVEGTATIDPPAAARALPGDATAAALIAFLAGEPLDCAYDVVSEPRMAAIRRLVLTQDERLRLPLQGLIVRSPEASQIRLAVLPGDAVAVDLSRIEHPLLRRWLPGAILRLPEGVLSVPDATGERAWSWTGTAELESTGDVRLVDGVTWSGSAATLKGTLAPELRELEGTASLLNAAVRLPGQEAERLVSLLPRRYARLDAQLRYAQGGGNAPNLELDLSGSPAGRAEADRFSLRQTSANRWRIDVACGQVLEAQAALERGAAQWALVDFSASADLPGAAQSLVHLDDATLERLLPTGRLTWRIPQLVWDTRQDSVQCRDAALGVGTCVQLRADLDVQRNGTSGGTATLHGMQADLGRFKDDWPALVPPDGVLGGTAGLDGSLSWSSAGLDAAALRLQVQQGVIAQPAWTARGIVADVPYRLDPAAAPPGQVRAAELALKGGTLRLISARVVAGGARVKVDEATSTFLGATIRSRGEIWWTSEGVGYELLSTANAMPLPGVATVTHLVPFLSLSKESTALVRVSRHDWRRPGHPGQYRMDVYSTRQALGQLTNLISGGFNGVLRLVPGMGVKSHDNEAHARFEGQAGQAPEVVEVE